MSSLKDYKLHNVGTFLQDLNLFVIGQRNVSQTVNLLNAGCSKTRYGMSQFVPINAFSREA